MEIAITVPYEIKIDAEGINLDTFDCFFTIYKDSVSYSISLDHKEDFYILKVPKELAFLGGELLKYEVIVRKENATFVASEGELTILGMTPSQFKVDIKAQNVKKPSKKEEEKEQKEKPEEETKKPSKEKPKAEKKPKPEKKEVKEEENPKRKSTILQSSGAKFSFLNNITDKPLKEEIELDPNDPNVKLKKILGELKNSGQN